MAPEKALACPGSLEKVIPIPSSLHVHLRWWLDPAKVLSSQPLHPLQHALQLFTDASNEGWGAHFGDYMAKGVWLESEGALHINLLELKAVLLALKWFERLCCNQIVLVCTDNTTVVSYINKEGGMKSGSLCALLWRLMLWCNQRQIVLRARHIPGHLNVIADKLSRLNQVIQTEWSLLPEVFAQICRRWHRPSVDLFATRFNHKLPRFVSPVPDRSAWEVDALSLPWEDLDASTDGPSSSGGNETFGPRIPSSHSDSTRLAQHALVLGPGQHVSSNSPPAPSGVEFDNSTVQSVSSPGPSQSEPSCLAPRASAIQQAGFSAEVATRIEAPQRRSTRAIYESKWSVFVRWCEKNQVDFRTPSIEQIADFLLPFFRRNIFNLVP